MAYPATLADLKAAVVAMVRLDSTDDAARVTQWLNETYSEVAIETRCFQQTSTATTTAGVSSYTLDTSILHLELVTCTQVGGTAWFPLAEAQLDEILNYRAVSPSTLGPPRRYALVGLSQLEVWPTPGEADTLTFWYSYAPAVLSGDTDVPGIPEPFASNCLIYGAACKAAEWKRDLMMLGDFQQQYASHLAGFQRYVNRKAGAYPEAFPTWTRLRPYLPADRSTDIPAVYGV